MMETHCGPYYETSFICEGDFQRIDTFLCTCFTGL